MCIWHEYVKTEQRKRLERKGEYLVTSVLVIFMGLICILFGAYELVGLCKPMKDFNCISTSELVLGEYVEGEINYCLSYYNQKYYIKGDSYIKRIYLIPFGTEKNEYLGIDVGEKNYAKFDNLIDETLNYINGVGDEPQSIGKYQGRIVKAKKDVQSYINIVLEELEDVENKKDYFDITAVPYVISYQTAGDMWLVFSAGVALVLIGIFLKNYALNIDVKGDKSPQNQYTNSNINQNINQNINISSYNDMRNLSSNQPRSINRSLFDDEE